MPVEFFVPGRIGAMTRSFRLLLVSALLGLSAAPALSGQPAPAEPRGVVELFTSQGCSSCPAADALFVELARDPGLIALTFPVTYWDYLGWKDTLGKDVFTKRQKLYAKARGDGQIYTPQAVIDGAAHAVGSDRAAIESALRGRPSLPVKVRLEEADGTLKVTLTAVGPDGGQAGGIWVLPVTAMAVVPIGRGENQGRTVSYANVVRGLVRIGEWNGTATTVTAPLAATRGPETDGYVVLVQTDIRPGHGGAILGAARRKAN
jgi:hypothetical protein